MNFLADRYTKIAQAYLKLSDTFQQLDVEHMRLKQKLVPLLKTLQSYQRISAQWKQKKTELDSRIQSLEAENAALSLSLETVTLQNTQLSESLASLDQDHAQTLGQVDVLQTQKDELEIKTLTLNAENNELLGKLQTLDQDYQVLKPLEGLLDPGCQALLNDAETQSVLVEETLQEMEQDSDPDLSPADKDLLVEYEQHPERFTLLAVELGEGPMEDAPTLSAPIDIKPLPQSAA